MCLIDPDRIHPELDIMPCDTVALPHHIVPYLVPPLTHFHTGTGVQTCLDNFVHYTFCYFPVFYVIKAAFAQSKEPMEPAQDLASAMEYQHVKHK